MFRWENLTSHLVGMKNSYYIAPVGDWTHDLPHTVASNMVKVSHALNHSATEAISQYMFHVASESASLCEYLWPMHTRQCKLWHFRSHPWLINYAAFHFVRAQMASGLLFVQNADTPAMFASDLPPYIAPTARSRCIREVYCPANWIKWEFATCIRVI